MEGFLRTVHARSFSPLCSISHWTLGLNNPLLFSSTYSYQLVSTWVISELARRGKGRGESRRDRDERIMVRKETGERCNERGKVRRERRVAGRGGDPDSEAAWRRTSHVPAEWWVLPRRCGLLVPELLAEPGQHSGFQRWRVTCLWGSLKLQSQPSLRVEEAHGNQELRKCQFGWKVGCCLGNGAPALTFRGIWQVLYEKRWENIFSPWRPSVL